MEKSAKDMEKSAIIFCRNEYGGEIHCLEQGAFEVGGVGGEGKSFATEQLAKDRIEVAGFGRPGEVDAEIGVSLND